MRLAFVGQRAITFGPLRRLFGALLAGAVLQLADVLCAGVCSALTALLEGPRATQLAVAQLVLSLPARCVLGAGDVCESQCLRARSASTWR